MKFAQIIEFKTSRIDEFNANLHAWMVKSDGHRIRHRALLRTTATPTKQQQEKSK